MLSLSLGLSLFYPSQEEEDRDQPRDIVQSGIKKDEKSSNKTNKPDTIKTQNRFNGLEDRMDTCQAEDFLRLISTCYINSPHYFIMDKKSFIQRNCRGLKANYNEVLIVMSLFLSKCHLSSRNFLETVR